MKLFVALAHWIFAMKYFEVAIKTPAFLRSSSMSLRAYEMKKVLNDRILVVTNAAFGLVIITFFIVAAY